MACKRLAMIPARMGSQRLKRKNLRELDGVPLITRAIRKCKESGVFDEIWVNSEHPDFGKIAQEEGVDFHLRPPELGSDSATSEDFIYEFLKSHPCKYLFQVHSIAPLLNAKQVREFVEFMVSKNCDALISYIPEQIEYAFKGKPINFSFSEKTNSQDLQQVQKIIWCITGWKGHKFVSAYEQGECATYSGKIEFYPIDPIAGFVIKTHEDLLMADFMFKVFEIERK